MQGKVLLAEDDADLAELVRGCLVREGLEVLVVGDGKSALKQATAFVPDVILLDIGLPELDGLEVCRELRKTRHMPIMILSARGDDVDRIVGLELGADDYLGKPFHPREMVARVKALFRRLRLAGSPEPQSEILLRRGLRLNLDAQTVDVDGEEVPLTRLEFTLLKTLMTYPGHVLDRQKLLDLVWGAEFAGDERVVDTHIKNIRLKLRKASPKEFISSVRSLGYRFDV